MNKLSFHPLFQRVSSAPTPSQGPALERFHKSMRIGYLEWHDGIGYDLDALTQMSQYDLKTIETLMISRKDQDWRDVEALAALSTNRSVAALQECLHSHNNEVKLFAVKFLKEMEIADHVEEVVLETLPETKIGEGMTFALDLAKRYPTERIKQKVLWCSLNGNDDLRIHCAALTLYLYGVASSDFDSSYTVIFEFREPDRAKRIKPFRELCGLVGVDPEEFIQI
jgi:hypothetical protein